jgi:hypothetical protein
MIHVRVADIQSVPRLHTARAPLDMGDPVERVGIGRPILFAVDPWIGNGVSQIILRIVPVDQGPNVPDHGSPRPH